MNTRKKIKVVTGAWGDHVMPSLWHALSSKADVEFLVLESENVANIQTSLPVVLFPVVADMPGFYRDLENYIQGADLVVAIESARLSSFQALRCSKSLGIGCVILNHEFTPFVYDKFSNIRAIQFDLHQNADHFLVSSNRAMRLVQSEGVELERITRVPHYCSVLQDGFSQARRDKFRNYINIASGEILVVARCSFEQVDTGSAIIRGFKLALSKQHPAVAQRCRLLMIGRGEFQESLKYESSDLGLGSRIIFMAQDPSPFWKDVVSAADAVIWDRWRDRGNAEPYPFGFLQGLAAGVATLIPAGTIFDEASVGAPVHRLEDLAALDVGEALTSILMHVDSLKSNRNDLAEFMSSRADVEYAVQAIMSVVEKLTAESTGPTSRERVVQFLSRHQDPLNSSEAKELRIKLEELLLLDHLGSELVADLWRVKGDIQVATLDTEGAVMSFEKALQIDDKCYRASRGMGYIAWSGHGHEEAASFFKRALAIEPNDYYSVMGIGLVYRRLKMLKESIFWLMKAVDIGGSEASALSLLVQACVESSHAELSLETLEVLRESYGDLPVLLRGLSQVYLAQGRADEAGSLIDQATA